uniref:Uncharacterized protein n=1 Tax=Ananas comosus var. bracteatus TaxID=296719 RepID=A0A6V7P5R0_ANACO|nr:unnamed protein product [Ananas comosus var. bracteatus]
MALASTSQHSFLTGKPLSSLIPAAKQSSHHSLHRSHAGPHRRKIVKTHLRRILGAIISWRNWRWSRSQPGFLLLDQSMARWQRSLVVELGAGLPVGCAEAVRTEDQQFKDQHLHQPPSSTTSGRRVRLRRAVLWRRVGLVTIYILCSGSQRCRRCRRGIRCLRGILSSWHGCDGDQKFFQSAGRRR